MSTTIIDFSYYYIFSHLTAKIYENIDCDHIILCGDYNARIGTSLDTIAEVDHIMDIQVLDNTKSGHCVCFDFLLITFVFLRSRWASISLKTLVTKSSYNLFTVCCDPEHASKRDIIAFTEPRHAMESIKVFLNK